MHKLNGNHKILTMFTPHQAQYIAWQLQKQTTADNVEAFASTLANAQIDLNPHQIDAAIFACKNPLSRGVLLADEVGLGKTIEAGLVIAQRIAERKKHILIITPANLRKQWHQELQEKFAINSVILEKNTYSEYQKKGQFPFHQNQAIICSYEFAKQKAAELKGIAWDLVVFDEAHRLRNVYKNNNKTAQALKEALAQVSSKVLLTATPLQNSILELYGLVSFIDDKIFGDLASFKEQFGGNNPHNLAQLRHRLQYFCQRTLRRQVQAYVSYTSRLPIVQEFTPSQEENLFAESVRDYLRREESYAMPNSQRHLISMILWKLLASSRPAMVQSFTTIIQRLQSQLDEYQPSFSLSDELNRDYESLDEIIDESNEENPNFNNPLSLPEKHAIQAEIEELQRYIQQVQSIQTDSKAQALLTALDTAFTRLKTLGAASKAIIFTESKRTQEYLAELLQNSPYAGENGAGIVLFNGDNNSKQAKQIYQNWLERHAGSDLITGSKTADTRAALVEYFRDQATIMIATEAGSEGINLQFCSLVVNYDLPWNPQRIEQRIGRCHRYGQKHDVVVVNFIDKTNEADRRVYELLEQKFKLFDGVFGASDEVLGSIGSGVDIEKRIAAIYRNCRTASEIQTAFEQLQAEYAEEIQETTLETRKKLLENFDEEVQSRLQGISEQTHQIKDEYTARLMQLTQSELQGYADFDGEYFVLNQLPQDLQSNSLIPLGKYTLQPNENNAHLYRISHPLAQALIERAKQRQCPTVKLTFDYESYGKKISTLEPYRGKTGQLIVRLVNIQSPVQQEQHLIISACTIDGEILMEDDPEKLLKLPAIITKTENNIEINELLLQNLQQRQATHLQEMQDRNAVYFTQETEKLDAWADDLKNNLEQAIKNTDEQIKEMRKNARLATHLQDKIHWEEKQRELERKRKKQRRELYDQQDDIDEQREQLLKKVKANLDQKVEEKTLFLIEWEMR
ncbi:SNF2-related protein [Avibacterium paragallinarum]|uniref:SNF2-related protein n=1 Tax=Avibacterium paragallinarum TaxID=728 RepID=UPI003978D9D0